MKGVEDFMIDAQAREGLYDFIARYVRKVCPDSLIMKVMWAMPGYTFLDLIRPSDVPYVISLLKNGRGMWDMEIEMREMARSWEKRTEAKARPLFTGGKGKKKEMGKNLWTKEKQEERGGARIKECLLRWGFRMESVIILVILDKWMVGFGWGYWIVLHHVWFLYRINPI